MIKLRKRESVEVPVVVISGQERVKSRQSNERKPSINMSGQHDSVKTKQSIDSLNP